MTKNNKYITKLLSGFGRGVQKAGAEGKEKGEYMKLPDHFFMGAAMSGPQTEGAYKTGGKLENLWDIWSDASSSDFYNKVGSYVGNNFYEK